MLAKQPEIDKHMAAMAEAVRSQKGRDHALAVAAVMKELPGWMESLRADSLQELFTAIQTAATAAVDHFQDAITVDSLWQSGKAHAEQLSASLKEFSAAMSMAKTLLVSKVPPLAALCDRTTPMLEKLTSNVKVSDLCQALLPWVDDERKRKTSDALPDVTEEEYTQLADVFQTDDGWVGLSEYIENIELAFKMVSAKLLKDVRKDQQSLSASLRQKLYTCLSRMSRACGNSGHSSLRQLLLLLLAPTIQLSSLMDSWTPEAEVAELKGTVCSMKSASARVTGIQEEEGNQELLEAANLAWISDDVDSFSVEVFFRE